MSRALLIIMDSVGIGGAPDAAEYGDAGSNTLGNIIRACASGEGDRAGLRAGPLNIPNLAQLGLGEVVKLAGPDLILNPLPLAQAATPALPPPPCGEGPGVGVESENSLPQARTRRSAPASPQGGGGAILARDSMTRPLQGKWGIARERSKGKDTPSGHWEICGVPVTFDWGYFPRAIPCFPKALTDELIARCKLPGVLGNKHASGTGIIAELGAEHMASGKPIVYTSADSVLQIAAHEQTFGLRRLYDVCEAAFALTAPLNIGRVIARPFLGDAPATFLRTANRRDFAIPPPAPTLLDVATAAGREVVSIGKIGDIFAHRGTGRIVKASGHPALMEATLETLRTLADGGLAIVNFVDFDMLFGHRRDVPGYADALEKFDAMLPRLFAALKPGDLAILTADHGNDPTAPGTDHTRECVPVLAIGPGIAGGPIGMRETLADIGQTIARHLGLPPLAHGVVWR